MSAPIKVFVTVGTHEDPFNRLVAAADKLAADPHYRVKIQSGYSTVACQFAAASAMMPFDTLQAAMAEADVVITHGGPASIMQAFSHGKVPVVVPRQSQFGEHVDDHQRRFARRLADRAVIVEDIGTLETIVRGWPAAAGGLRVQDLGPERARSFALGLDRLIDELLVPPVKPQARWRRIFRGG